MHSFIKIGGLFKRGLLHLAGGIGIGLVSGKRSILPVSVAIAGKEIKDPHPVENRNRWILKSVLDWAEWTVGTVVGAKLRKRWIHK